MYQHVIIRTQCTFATLHAAGIILPSPGALKSSTDEEWDGTTYQCPQNYQQVDNVWLHYTVYMCIADLFTDWKVKHLLLGACH